MTVIVGGFLVILSLVFGAFFNDLGDVASARVRAQLAADAGALAAVAENAPYGSGAGYATARRFVEANGAELVECDCIIGSGAAQVEVQVDGVTASARAVLDPRLLGPLAMGSTQGLDPRLESAVNELVRASGGAVRVVSGWRSRDEQEILWSHALARYGSPEAADDWVAPPGSSMHERGLAVDLGGDLVLATRLVAELGLPLYRPLANEAWHFELLGSRG